MDCRQGCHEVIGDLGQKFYGDPKISIFNLVFFGRASYFYFFRVSGNPRSLAKFTGLPFRLLVADLLVALEIHFEFTLGP